MTMLGCYGEQWSLRYNFCLQEFYNLFSRDKLIKENGKYKTVHD